MTKTEEFPNLKKYLYEIQAKKNLSDGDILRDRKNVLDLKIVILIDVSGSISQETFVNFMLQVDKIRGLSKVKILEFDTRVIACYDYFKTNQSEVMRLTGGGGTYFGPVFKEAERMNADNLIIMTDGDNFDADFVSPDIPTALVLTEGGKNTYGWKQIGTVPNHGTIKNDESAEARELDSDVKRDNDELKDLEAEEEDEEE